MRNRYWIVICIILTLVLAGLFFFLPNTNFLSSNINQQSSSFFLNAEVTGCQPLSIANTEYILSQNVTSTGTCFTVTAQNVTLNCAGYAVNYSTNGTVGYGVFTNQFNTTVKNCIITEGNTAGNNKHVIFFSGADNGTVYNNTLTSIKSSNVFTARNGALNNNISNNRMFALEDFTAHGINLVGGSGTTMANNYIFIDSANGDGITINSGSHNFLVDNNTIDLIRGGTSSDGISVLDSYNGIIKNSFINVTGVNSAGLMIDDSVVNFTVIDTTIISTDLHDVLVKTSVSPNSRVTFINVTFDKDDVTINDNDFTLEVKYYLDVNVTDSSDDSAIENALVNVTYNNETLFFSELTDGTGFITRQNATEYIQNTTGKFFFTNYTMNTTATSFNQDDREINFSDNIQIDISMSSGAPADNPPVVTLVSPSNDTSSDSISEYSFNTTLTDDINITNTTFNLWFDNGTLFNTTEWLDLSATTEYGANSTVNLTQFGNYTWNYLVYDNSTAGNSAWATNNFTIEYFQAISSTIDLEIITPIDFNGRNATKNEFFNVTINVTCRVANCGEINVSLDPIELGTNAGFLLEGQSPSVDPAGSQTEMDDETRATKDTAPVGATKVTEIGWWNDVVTEDADYDVAIYTHNIGDDNPESLVGSSVGTAKGTITGWKKITGLNIPITAGTIYWIAVRLENTATQSYTNRGSGGVDAGKSSLGALPDPWGLNDFDGSNILSFYALTDAPSTKGLISTTIGDTPFYTNKSNNPFTTSSLNVGQSELVTFWVNATGTINDTYTFFAYANQTSELSVSNISNTWEVTINSSGVADTINITYPTQYTLYQRHNSTTGEIRIFGIYDGSPTTIEAQFNGDGWKVIDASPSGNVFSGVLNASVGNGTLEVRYSNDVGITDTQVDISIGDLFVIGGQSNAEGRATNAQLLDTSNQYLSTVYRQDDSWIIADDPIDIGTSSGSLWPLLANNIIQNQSIPVGFISTAQGGTRIGTWISGTSNYDSMINQVSEATNGTMKVKTMLFWQGEADVNNSGGCNGNYSCYKELLVQMGDDFIRDTNISTTVMIAQIGDVHALSASRWKVDNIRKAQQDAWEEDNNISYGSINYDIGPLPDRLHQKTDLQMQISGNRWWASIANNIYGITSEGTPPQLNSSFLFNSTRIILNITESQGLGIRNYSQDNGVKIQGFYITNGAVFLNDSNITSTQILGNQIIINLNVPIDSDYNISFASNEDAVGKFVLTDNSTYNLPLIPIYNSTLLSLDDFPPNINFTNPTPSNDTIILRDWIFANVTATDDTGIDTIIINLYNETDLINSSTCGVSPCELNFTNLPPDLYFLNSTANDTLNQLNSTETRQFRLIQNTSYLGRGFDLVNFSFSSPTDTLAYSIQFNSSLPQTNYGVLASFNLIRNTGGGNTDVGMRVDIDGVIISDKIIRSLNVPQQYGVTGIEPLFFNVSNGNHTIDIYFRRTGNGVISIENMDFSMGRFETPRGITGRGNFTLISIEYDSTTPLFVFNKTIFKNVNTSTYIASTFSVSATAQTDVICRFVDGGESPYFVVSIPDGSTTRSVSTNYITTPNSLQENVSLQCFNSVGGVTTNITGGFIEADMADDVRNPINHGSVSNNLTNYTNTRILTAGTHLLVSRNFTMQDGTNVLFSTQVSAGSQSGAQTPTYFVNASFGTNASSCNSIKFRYHGGADIGNSFFYPVCEGLLAGDEYNFAFYVTVPAGETLEIFDESLSLFENTLYDISTSNTPPTISLVNPINGSFINGINNVTWIISDTQLDSTLTNITLVNSTGSFNSTNLPSSLNYTEWDSVDFANGNYNITTETCENETADFFCGNNTVSITIDNTPPILIILLPTNNTNTTDTQIDIDFIAVDINLDTCFWGNETTNTTLANCDINITDQTWNEGLNNITVYANDSSNNLISDFVRFRVDTLPPVFDHELTTQTVTESQSLLYDINATDSGIGVDGFAINDTYGGLFEIGFINGSIINISTFSSQAGEYYFNITVNDTLNNKNTSILLVNVTAVDATPPNLEIVFPTNNTNSSNNNLNVNYTVSDTVGLDECWYSNDSFSVNTSLASCGTNITTITWSEGTHVVRVYANDTSGNENVSQVTFNIDTINPNVEIVHPPNLNETTDTQIDVNYTFSDLNVDTCWWSDGPTNTTIACGTNITEQVWEEGFNQITAYVNDTANNVNSSSVVFLLDTRPPVFSHNLDTQTITESQNLLYDINATDAGVGVANYSINDTYGGLFEIGLGNGTIINISTLNSQAGEYYFNVSVNDTLGNTNTSILLVNVTLPADTINPNINITFPNNGLETTDTGLDVNYTTSDNIALDTCWWTEDTGVTNNTLASCTTNITGETWTEGANTITVYVNDTSDNQNSSTVTFTLDTLPPSFTNLANQTLQENQELNYNINAADTGVGLDGFAINDTYGGLFSINFGTGVLTNASTLVGQDQEYWFRLSVNDTLGNTNTTDLLVNVTEVPADVTPPTFDNPRNITHTVNTSLSESFAASDTSGIDTYTLNDTSVFSINGAGLITNVTALETITIYNLNLTVNDTAGNQNSLIFWINVTEFVIPVSQCGLDFEILQSASSNKRPYGRLCQWLDFR